VEIYGVDHLKIYDSPQNSHVDLENLKKNREIVAKKSAAPVRFFSSRIHSNADSGSFCPVAESKRFRRSYFVKNEITIHADFEMDEYRLRFVDRHVKTRV
jgi:hypothetical protein